MIITFENILEQVVNNRSLSRKEKQLAINKFLKDRKAATPEETKILETLKAIKKTYSAKDNSEKTKRTA